MDNDYKPTEKVVKVIEKIKEMTAAPAIFMEVKPDAEPALTDSKFGGLPYWDLDKEYPTDGDGDKMIMLAQINFSDIKDFDTVFPKEGMLQFFIKLNDDLYGLDFDEPDVQEGFRIVYHETVRTDVTEDMIRELGVSAAEDCSECYTPVDHECALSFQLKDDYINPDVYNFDEIFVQAVKELTGEDIEGKASYEYFSDDDNDYLYEELTGFAHKMLGYPGFTQADPREGMSEEDIKYYDTILFQMDSDGEDGDDYVLWGDCGIANWFINSEALKRKDFSKVMYNWDCC